LYGVGEAVQVIGGRDQDILDAAGFHVRQDTHPERGAFILAEPEAQHFFLTVPAEPHGNVNGLVDHLGVLTHLEDDPVHPDDHVDFFQGAILPGHDVFAHAVRYPGYRARGKSEVVYLVELLFDVGIAHPLGVQGDHQGLDPLCHAFSLGHDGGFKTAVPIPGNVNAGFTEIGLDRFTPVPVTGVRMPGSGMFIVTQVMIKLTLEHLLDTSFV